MIYSTPRLIIRIAQPTDVDADMYLRLWNDGRVMVQVGFPNGVKTTREEILQRLSTQGPSELEALLVVERKSDRQRVGECKLGKPDEEGIVETDVKLLPEFWGHAYGVEVKRGLLDYLFSHTDCRAVRATPNVKNIPSIRMQEAVGGVCIGESVYEFPEEMREFTTPVHCYTYEVTRQAWEALPHIDPAGEVTVHIRKACELEPGEQKTVEDMVRRVFRDEPFGDMVWIEVDWKVVVYLGGVLASHVEIVDHTVSVGGQPVRVGGIGGVATLPECRGLGLASKAMSAATDFMRDKLKLEFGLLVCSERRRSFYESMSWQAITEPVYYDQPSGKVKNEGITMSLSLSGKPWPTGVVDFCGYPW